MTVNTDVPFTYTLTEVPFLTKATWHHVLSGITEFADVPKFAPPNHIFIPLLELIAISKLLFPETVCDIIKPREFGPTCLNIYQHSIVKEPVP